MIATPSWVASPRAQRLLDAAIAIVTFGIGLGGHLAASNDRSVEAAPAGPLILAFAACAAAVLVWRRFRPLAMVGALAVIAVASGVVGEPSLFSLQLAVELAVLCHAIGSWARYPRRGVVVVLLVGVLLAIAAIASSGLLAGTAFVGALVGLPYAVGLAARQRRRYLEAVEDRLRQTERERDERALRAVAEERARLARELHDVIAHHVSLIGVQAGAARVASDVDPTSLQAALVAIEHSSREAIAELRRVLDVLGPAEHGEERHPAPNLDRLGDLRDSWKAAGVDVELVINRESEAPTPVPDDLAACCFRIVEEALTNVARHSQARRAQVTVTVSRDSVEISVVDDGPARPSTSDGSGRGLWGMRQRVALFDGRLDAAPTLRGGFRVQAILRSGS